MTQSSRTFRKLALAGFFAGAALIAPALGQPSVAQPAGACGQICPQAGFCNDPVCKVCRRVGAFFICQRLRAPVDANASVR